jgi:hypothetical protein
MIDHLEPFRALGIIDARDFHQLLILGLVTQGRHHGNERLALHHKADLVRRLDKRKQIGAHQRTQGIRRAFGMDNSGSGMHAAHLSIVPMRRILRWSCMMP